MFRQFKRRQLISNVGILTVLLFVIFSSIFLSTYRDVTARNTLEIERLIDTVNIDAPDQPLSHSPGYSISFILLVTNDAITGTYFGPGVTEQFVEDSYAEIDGEKGTITIDDYTFQYDSKTVNDSTIYGFVDITRDIDLLQSLLIRYSIIFIASIVTTLFVTYFITSKSIQPVKESYEKQKEFIANASHELKTPLTVISANVDVLQSNPSFKDNKWLGYIKSEATRMNKLTNDLLYLAQTSDIQHTIKEPFNASKVVEGLSLTFEALAYEKNIELICDISADIELSFHPSQFKQLVLILLDNAIKYTPQDERITVSLTKQNKAITLSVKNTGVSLTEEERNNLFDRFYMTDKSRETRQDSYGLGLSIAREIAKNNDATLHVESLADTYTEFILKIRM